MEVERVGGLVESTRTEAGDADVRQVSKSSLKRSEKEERGRRAGSRRSCARSRRFDAISEDAAKRGAVGISESIVHVRLIVCA